MCFISIEARPTPSYTHPMNQEKPIDLLCELIDTLPDNAWGQKWARFEISHLLCIKMQPTGLEPTPDRTIGQLRWDHDIATLRDRMMILSENGVEPEFLVKGSLAILRESFSEQAGSEAAEQAIQANQEAIDHLLEIRKQPLEKQMDSLSDANIEQMISRHQSAIDTAFSNANEASATIIELDRLSNELFPREFWKAYRISRLK